MPWHMSIAREEVREIRTRTRAARRYFARFNMRLRSRTPGLAPGKLEADWPLSKSKFVASSFS